MSTKKYVHGYSQKENQRLVDQATTLQELLHVDSIYGFNEHVLEAGCGVGAQTVTLCTNNPHTRFTCIDISVISLAAAKQQAQSAGLNNISFLEADIFNLPFEAASFDHVFLCFVLEHLPEPLLALSHLARVLKPGGTITVIEGDHGSTYFHPYSIPAQKAVDCQVRLQSLAGGNALVGRQLYPLLVNAGFRNVHVSPRMVYVDASKPALVEGFVKKTFTAMIEGVRAEALKNELIDAKVFDQGIHDLYRTASEGGTFCYTFFKAVALR